MNEHATSLGAWAERGSMAAGADYKCKLPAAQKEASDARKHGSTARLHVSNIECSC